MSLPTKLNNFEFIFVSELKKDKTELSLQQANGGCVSPSGEPPPAPSLALPPTQENSKPERPSSLGPGKLTRRLLCYHNDHYNSSPTRPNVDNQSKTYIQ